MSELLKINLLARIIAVDTHQIASGIAIEHYTFRDLSALGTGLLRKDIKLIPVEPAHAGGTKQILNLVSGSSSCQRPSAYT